jgi:hypothetical protein
MITAPSWLFWALPFIVAATIWGARIWAKSFIEGRVKLSVDTEIEQLRSQLRQRETEIASLRDGVLSGRANRAAMIDKRRLDAIDQLWCAFVRLTKLKGPAMSLSMLKMEAVVKRAPTDKQFQQVLGMMMMAGNFEEEMKQARADAERPHVTDMAWALYAAYSSIILTAWAVMNALSQGVENVDQLIKADHADALLIAVLPHRKAAIERIGYTGFYHFLDELEALLLAEIKRELNGERADAEALRQAAQIMDAVKQVRADNDKLISSGSSPAVPR